MLPRDSNVSIGLYFFSLSHGRHNPRIIVATLVQCFGLHCAHSTLRLNVLVQCGVKFPVHAISTICHVFHNNDICRRLTFSSTDWLSILQVICLSKYITVACCLLMCVVQPSHQMSFNFYIVTLPVFNKNIIEISKYVKNFGILLYMYKRIWLIFCTMSRV
jgi:hypothetical protein